MAGLLVNGPRLRWNALAAAGRSFYGNSRRQVTARKVVPLKGEIMTPSLRIAVLLSGSGTTLQNLLDRSADGRLPARVVQVVSSRPDTYGLTRARGRVPAAVIERKECASREE